MHLVAACDMDFTIDGRTYHMAKGETIHSENSHKYGPRDANLLLRAGGWTPVATWDDADPAFALILAKATEFRSAPCRLSLTRCPETVGAHDRKSGLSGKGWDVGVNIGG